MVRGVVGFGPPLSKIAVSKAHGEDSPYFAGWKAYDENPYDAASNPLGVIQMGLAENQVSFDLLEDYLEHHPEISSWGSSGISGFKENALFQDYCGLPTFRKAMASFMEEIRGKRVRFDPERIVLSAGATAANELLTFILADPGDAFLVPTPFYPGFIRDIQWRTGARMVPVPCHSSDAFQLTVDSLQAAYSRAKACSLRVKALLITNPSNPLGTTIPRPLLEDILDFVASKSIHLISDEIYSGSVFSSSEDFLSVAELVELRGGGQNFPGVHIVYSLSKDLGLPGFRVGAIYSYNDGVVATARRMSSFSLVSSQTQMLLASMLSDEDFTSRYVRINKERLERRRARIVGGLKDAGIECLEGNAGLFCWMNLAPLLDERSVEGELRLWRMMLSEAKLNVSPGSSCCCAEAGWFRVCFANMSEQTLDVALARIKAFADEKEKLLLAASSASKPRETGKQVSFQSRKAYGPYHSLSICGNRGAARICCLKPMFVTSILLIRRATSL